MTDNGHDISALSHLGWWQDRVAPVLRSRFISTEYGGDTAIATAVDVICQTPELRSAPFGLLLPGLADTQGPPPIEVLRLSVRTTNRLRSETDGTWNWLAQISVSTIAGYWVNAGTMVITEILTQLLNAWPILPRESDGTVDSTENSPTPDAASLLPPELIRAAILLQRLMLSEYKSGASTVGDVIFKFSGTVGNDEYWEAFESIPIPDLFGLTPNIDQAWERALALGDRPRLVLAKRPFALAGKLTLDEIGKVLGTRTGSPDRTRRLEQVPGARH